MENKNICLALFLKPPQLSLFMGVINIAELARVYKVHMHLSVIDHSTCMNV